MLDQMVRQRVDPHPGGRLLSAVVLGHDGVPNDNYLIPRLLATHSTMSSAMVCA